MGIDDLRWSPAFRRNSAKIPAAAGLERDDLHGGIVPDVLEEVQGNCVEWGDAPFARSMRIHDKIAMTESSTSNKPARRRWLLLVVAVVILIGCVVGLVLWNKSASEKFSRQMAESQPADPDARSRSLVVGAWADEYQGKRTMTLNDDGTGTMIVELSGWRAALSAPRLKFNMKWSVKDGHLKKQTISGKPETQVKMILCLH